MSKIKTKSTYRFTKKLHKDDKAIMIRFIDYARIEKKENITLEISARYVAEYIKVNANTSNGRLANKFAALLENKLIA